MEWCSFDLNCLQCALKIAAYGTISQCTLLGLGSLPDNISKMDYKSNLLSKVLKDASKSGF